MNLEKQAETNLTEGKARNLTAADFDSQDLELWQCRHYLKKHDLPFGINCTTDATIKDDFAANGASLIPSDMTNRPAYDETQKLTHFTYVFNIFVFLQIFKIAF